MPPLLLPQKGRYGLRDYEKIFCADGKSGQDIFALRGIPVIATAPLSDNPFPDGTPAFFEGFARVATGALDHGLTIEVPFRQIAKSEVIRRGRDLPLGSTFSCIQPSGLDHCGDCTKCAERQQGFATAGVADPTRYRNPAAPRSRSA